jgi:hypothetical protein
MDVSGFLAANGAVLIALVFVAVIVMLTLEMAARSEDA